MQFHLFPFFIFIYLSYPKLLAGSIIFTKILNSTTVNIDHNVSWAPIEAELPQSHFMCYWERGMHMETSLDEWCASL